MASSSGSTKLILTALSQIENRLQGSFPTLDAHGPIATPVSVLAERVFSKLKPALRLPQCNDEVILDPAQKTAFLASCCQ